MPSTDAASELKNITDKSHVMVPEALTLKEVHRLISLTKSLMEDAGGKFRTYLDIA